MIGTYKCHSQFVYNRIFNIVNIKISTIYYQTEWYDVKRPWFCVTRTLMGHKFSVIFAHGEGNDLVTLHGASPVASV
jgi:hypothetical protein